MVGCNCFGWITLRRLVHHLCPDRQRERRTVTVRNNCCRLVEPDPDTARQRAGVTHKPRILVIVRRTGLARCRQFEA